MAGYRDSGATSQSDSLYFNSTFGRKVVITGSLILFNDTAVRYAMFQLLSNFCSTLFEISGAIKSALIQL
jgi:hypothetical protein